MPVLDGMATASILQHHGFTTPIIATTANACGVQLNMDNVDEKYRFAGFNGIVGKPFSKSEIGKVLRHFGV
ncbi:hypothetical protein HDU76_001270 [Blyttiomyces sp. JEL0837]|nr:hypothetical protein HDU76_001270 [Blyttiomyces sp. JEL0837]